MKPRFFGFFLCALALALSACGETGTSSQASSAGTASSSGNAASSLSSSGGSSGSSGAVSSASSNEPSEPLPSGWAGLVRIYYHNDAANYAQRTLWVWGVGVDGAEYAFDNISSPDDFGVYKIVDLSAAPWNARTVTSLSFIVKFKNTWSGQSQDIVCPLNDFSSSLETGGNGKEMITVYGVDGGNGTIATYAKRSDALGDRIQSMDFTDWRTLAVAGMGASDGRVAADIGKVSAYSLYGFPSAYYLLSEAKQASTKENFLLTSGAPDSNSFVVTLAADANPSLNYEMDAVFASDASKTKTKSASFVDLYDDSKFTADYTYAGNDLGLSFTAEGNPVFKLWAPTASRARVRYYQSGTPVSLGTADQPGYDALRTFDMTYGEKGVWTYVGAAADLTLWHYYTYVVTNSGQEAETIDPYAKACGINGIRGAIVAPSAWNMATPEGFSTSLSTLEASHPLARPNDLTVYEAHIRDFTADSSWISNAGNANGTYNAFGEAGTIYGNGTVTVKTGFDSLKELGPNAVQLLPVFDQANDERTLTDTVGGLTTVTKPGYNWGYNPLNFDIPEGAYSSDPYTPLVRVSEYKNLIKTLADSGMRVVMDVVYNHMASAVNSCFGKTMPEYFFKMAADGSYLDETGVNNTFNSSRAMAQKYIVDSVCYWAREYGIKGFRFDLMGALETSCLRAVKDALYAIDPSIVVYGEGWRGIGSSDDTEAGTFQVYRDLTDNGKGAVACFNDCGRDGLKGNTAWGSPAPSYGFMSQGASDLSDDTMYDAACVYLGENRAITTKNPVTLASSPEQTVNYASCHDNYTLYDQLNYCSALGAGADGDANPGVQDAALATNAFILMSQGLAFFQGGEEIFRQKIMQPGDADWDKLEEADYVLLPSGNRLVRNSYSCGDAVNSFKWGRKAEFSDYFAKFAEAFKTRQSLIDQGILGVSYDLIQGTFASNNQTLKYSRLWDDLTTLDASNLHRPILAAQTQWSKKSASGKDIYVFLGGRMSGDGAAIGCGAGELKVLYGTRRAASSLFEVSSANALDIGSYEMMIVERES